MAASAKAKNGGTGMLGPNVWTSAADPTVDNDVDNGINIGDHWVNTTPTPRTIHICVSNANGAAAWRLVTTS